jgi:transposase
MIALPSGVRVWIAAGHSDMRRGMHSLALQVQEVLKRNPHAGDLYVFRGRRLYAGRNRLEKSAAHVATDRRRMSVDNAAAL